MIDKSLTNAINEKKKKLQKKYKHTFFERVLFEKKNINELKKISGDFFHKAFIEQKVGLGQFIYKNNSLVIKNFPFGYSLVEIFVFNGERILNIVENAYDAEKIVSIPEPCNNQSVKKNHNFWHLKKILYNGETRIPETLPDGRNWDGSGVKLGIIDTGVGPHPELYRNIKFYKDYINEPGSDLNGHGTHVAGISVSIAPDLMLFSLKTFNKDGRGTLSNIISAIVDAVKLKLDIINMSFGVEWLCDGNCPICRAVDYAYEHGVISVASAGNSGPKKLSIHCPGNSKKCITVGATTNNEIVASFSSCGPTIDGRVKPDLVAPGQEILSTVPPDNYDYKSGTSMAAPMVSGVISLMVQFLRIKKIRNIIIDSTIDIKFDKFKQGRGIINAYKFWEKRVPKARKSSESRKVSGERIIKKVPIVSGLIAFMAIYALIKLIDFISERGFL